MKEDNKMQELLKLAKKLKSRTSSWWMGVKSEQAWCLGDKDGFHVSANFRVTNGSDPTKEYQSYLELCNPDVLIPLLEELEAYRTRGAGIVLDPIVTDLDALTLKIKRLAAEAKE